MENCEDSEGGGAKAELLDRNPAVAAVGMLTDPAVCSLNPGPATYWLGLEIWIKLTNSKRRYKSF